MVCNGRRHRSALVYPAAWADRGKPLEPHAHVGRKHTRRLPLGASQHCPLTRRGRSRKATLGHWSKDTKSRADAASRCNYVLSEEWCAGNFGKPEAAHSTELKGTEDHVQRNTDYSQHLSSSQLWESCVEKSQSQLCLGLRKNPLPPTQRSRRWMMWWPSRGRLEPLKMDHQRGSLWLYPVRKSITDFFFFFKKVGRKSKDFHK